MTTLYVDQGKDTRTTTMAIASAVLLHIFLAGAIVQTSPALDKPKDQPIKVQLRKFEKPKVEALEVKMKEPKTEPKTLPKEKPKTRSERKPLEKPQEPPKPIQGFNPDALSANGPGIVVPVGNTMMVEDEGKRLKEVKPLSNEDLSADARLIAGTVAPPTYTDDAVDANLEGYVVVDTYVDANGSVTQVELKKKVGYGMDERILAAAQKARFTPRKDKFGRAIAGWSEVKFRLEIP